MFHLQMMDNNVIESEYVGWGIQRHSRILTDIVAQLSTWKNNSKSFKVKQMTFRITNKKKYGYRERTPVICAFNVHGNETLYKASSV